MGDLSRRDQPSNASDRQPSLKVFVSYARADAAFADELAAGLEYDGRYVVMIDRQSIMEGEDWKRRLGTLIADADTVVFILTPTSVKSATCVWEVEEAYRLSKRILPVLAKPCGATVVPERLAALNYVRFDPLDDDTPRSFMAGLTALTRALNTDIDWLREQTRLLNLAHSWDEAGRPVNRLLSGADIVAAKRWVSQRPKDAPSPTDLHLEYIRASEAAEAKRESAERARLTEIETAQQARAQALKDAETAHAEKLTATNRLARRTKLGIGVAAALLVLAATLAALAWREHKNAIEQTELAVAQTQRAESESQRADRFVNLVSSHPAGERVMKKTCLEAIDTTFILATATDKEQHSKASDRFWELYYGPMYIVELHQRKQSGSDSSVIESAMKRYGDTFKEIAQGPLPHSALCEGAKAVAKACAAHLGVTSSWTC